MAREHPERAFSSIGHVIDIALLREAYRRTRKDGAVGVDGQTAVQYARELESNLGSLLNRFKSGRYRAAAVRRVEIPKASGGLRPLGIPTFEDKVLQRAVSMVLEAIYEQDFMDCSYGFRPRRSAHNALDSIWKSEMKMQGGWVLEVDIEKFFDSMSHEHLRSILDRRVTDGVVRRVVHKWLKAGVMRDGVHERSVRGTPQGGVISPLLANIYLHEVVDQWFSEQVRPRLKGRAFLVRYADDMVFGFEREEDARRVMAVLSKRFGKYGLRLHPDKTRLVRFEPPRGDDAGDTPLRESFDFLGFTHYWGKSRKGNWIVKRKTAKDRFARSLRRVSQWCKRFRHLPVHVQHDKLSAVMRGHYGYYGITNNGAMLEKYWYQVHRTWYRWLARRNSRGMLWERYASIVERLPLPRPRVVHSALRTANH